MKSVFMLSFVLTATIGFCSASSSVSLPATAAPASAAVPTEIDAPAPKVAPALPAPVPAAAPTSLKATDIIIPLGSTGKTVNLQELATMKSDDLEKMTGKKMSLLRRMEFKLAQRRLRHSISEDGTVKNKRLAMLASKDMDGTTGFHIGGFALGLLLGLIGVLIAYLINDEKKSNRVKWSWIGLGVLVVIILISVA